MSRDDTVSSTHDCDRSFLILITCPSSRCEITSREYCEFMRGYFHEEATLCSQVSADWGFIWPFLFPLATWQDLGVTVAVWVGILCSALRLSPTLSAGEVADPECSGRASCICPFWETSLELGAGSHKSPAQDHCKSSR